MRHKLGISVDVWEIVALLRGLVKDFCRRERQTLLSAGETLGKKKGERSRAGRDLTDGCLLLLFFVSYIPPRPFCCISAQTLSYTL